LATKIQIKRSTTGGNTPTLDEGELAVNLVDKRLFTANATTVFDALQNTASSFSVTTNAGEAILVGNSTVNVVANSTTIKLSNSTAAWTISKPTAAEISAGDYYLGSDGTWQLAGSASVGGTNTQIQYNDSGSFGGSDGFVFDESTNNVTIANTLTVNVMTVLESFTINTDSLSIGNSTVNAVVNSLALTIANSTVTWSLTKPTAAEVSTGNYYIGSDGTWQQPPDTVPGGSNTYIQYNDSSVFGGSAAFTFNESTNNVTIANTITVGSNFIANGSGSYPASNSVGTALGSTTQRWVITANTIDASGNITTTGNVNASAGYFTGAVNASTFTTTGNANAGAGYFGGVVNATTFTTTGNANAGAGYFGGVVNATTFTTTGNANAGNIYVTANANAAVFKTTGWVGNTIAINPTSNTIALGNSIGRWVITANSIDTQGFSGNATALNPTANTILLGNTIGRWVITANTVTTSGNITSGGNVNGAIGYFTSSVNATTFTTTGNINAAAGYFTSSVNATTFTTTGNVNGAAGFFTGTVNAAHFTTTGNMNAGSTYVTGGMYPASNSSGQTLGDGTHRWVITANSLATSGGIITSGGASPASNSSGTALGTTTARWILNANTINATGIITSEGGIYPSSNSSGQLLGGTLQRWVLIANTGNFSGIITTSGGVYPTSNSSGQLLGGTLQRWVLTANTGNFSGDVSYSGGSLTSTSITPTSNTVGNLLGDGTRRWNLTGNTLSLSSTATITGNVTTSGNINAAAGYFTGAVTPTSNTQNLGTTTARWVIYANSINTSQGIYTSSGMYPESNTVGTALGSTTLRWNLVGNTISVSSTITASGNVTTSGNINAAAGYFTGAVNASTFTTTGNANAGAGYFGGVVNATTFTTTGNANASIHYAGANVYANTTSVRVGNSIVNTIVANDTVYIGNTSVNCSINSTAIYFDGVEFSPGATPGGSNTYIQYNSSTALGGSVGFTFDESTNNVIVANNMDIATISTVSQYIFVGNDEINTVVGPGAIILGGKDIVGTQTRYIPSTAMAGRTTNGPSRGDVESTTNYQMIETLDFDTTTQEYAQFDILMPKSWALNGLRFQAIWSSNAASSGNVVWQFQARAYTTGDLIDGIWSDPVYTTTANVELAGSVRISPESSQLVPTNSPSQGCYVIVQVSRATGNTGDTMSGDARLHGVKMMYYTTHTTDD
jgi:hypothetical protein